MDRPQPQLPNGVNRRSLVRRSVPVGITALVVALLAAPVTSHARQNPPAAAKTSSPTIPAAAQVSPQAAYDEALRPVEITHRSIENWSDIETAALAVAIRQAKDACTARAPGSFSGEDLIALARLCALGQQWPSVLESASRYIGQPGTPQPQLAQAYIYQVEAALHMNDADVALACSRAMLERVPYGALTQQATSETARYLQLVRTHDAIALLELRQPLLLARLRNPAAVSGDLSLHALYAEGLALPALQQFANAAASAASAVSSLDAALPALTPDDALPIATARRQYALLGHPLPPIAAAVSLFSPTETPRINTDFGSTTVLILFPDWCAQCVRMGRQFLPTLFRLSEQKVHLYGLLAQATPPPVSAPRPEPRFHRPQSSIAQAAAAKSSSPALPSSTTERSPADLLRGTPTLIVSPAVLEQFGATDFPLLAVTDHSGIVRFVGLAPDNAFVAGGLLDQLTARIAEQWPSPEKAVAAPASR